MRKTKREKVNRGKKNFKLNNKNLLIIIAAVMVVSVAVTLTVVLVKRAKDKKAAEAARLAALQQITESVAETTTEETTTAEETTSETTTKNANIHKGPTVKPSGTTAVAIDDAPTIAPPKQEKPQSYAKILDVPYINQTDKYPTGCESISAVMALKYAGYNISPEEFIDNYLPKGNAPKKDETGTFFTDTNPYEKFMGDPYSKNGWGCYSPVIKKSLNEVINHSKNKVVDLGGSSMRSLCKYIDDGVPVIMWATVNMSPITKVRNLYLNDNGDYVIWKSPNHCLLLVGYDDSHYYFNDPMLSKSFAYNKADVEKAYNANGSQALAIVKYVPPTTKPTTTEKTTVLTTNTTTEMSSGSETTGEVSENNKAGN